jgi:hypothetical protein
MTRHRLVLYVLLNVLVSALVTGTVLYFYDRANPKPDCASNAIIPTLIPGNVDANILGVNGAGALGSEVVIIQNSSAEALELTGWTLKDGKGGSYTFPQLTLYPGGTVRVHSGTGTDTAADLYWRLPAPVWKSGALAALYDTQNIARAFYRIP